MIEHRAAQAPSDNSRTIIPDLYGLAQAHVVGDEQAAAFSRHHVMGQ